VKSGFDPLVYEGERVRWVIQHPLPLYLCVVDKPSLRFSIYHTFPRFYAWSLGQWPERLEMIPDRPEPGRIGRNTQWKGDYTFRLDQPILDFSIEQMVDDEFWTRARAVFDHWIRIENDNLLRIRANLLKYRMPGNYRTNEDWVGSWIESWFLFPEDEQFARTTAHLKEPLEWVGDQLLRKGDIKGAAEAALLHRHLYPEDRSAILSNVQSALNKHFNKGVYVYEGVDHLETVIQEELNPKPKKE
jgi:hypothetical protein